MSPLLDLQPWQTGIDAEAAEGEVRWLEELIGDADKAIDAQRRIIAHDGPLQAHLLSLAGLKASQTQLSGLLAEIMRKRTTEVLDFALFASCCADGGVGS